MRIRDITKEKLKKRKRKRKTEVLEEMEIIMGHLQTY